MVNSYGLNAYFAARNGYNGFKSYFKDVFDVNSFKRIFILKGGPGTGKSSFMKKLLQYAEEKKIFCERIYCSSDPNSLDGIILNKSIAVIDGTAPHEEDTKLPGVVDEIINLGENWNEDILKKNETDIKNLNKEKKDFYKSAYNYLSFCEKIDNYLFCLAKSNYDISAAKKTVGELISDRKKNNNPKRETRLISAFGRGGYTKLSTLETGAKKIFNVLGKYESEYVFMSLLYDFLCADYSFTLFPSPFSEEKIEAISFDKNETVIETNAASGEKIDTLRFLNFDRQTAEEAEFLTGIKAELLKKAEYFFSLASEKHFLLEKIYTAAMDFSKNEMLLEETKEKISKILKL